MPIFANFLINQKRSALLERVIAQPLHNIMKNNFYYVVIIIIGLVISLFALISTFITDNLEADNWLNWGLTIVEIAGFFMLVLNGTFIKTKYFRILKGLIAFALIGALIKILHWVVYGVNGNMILTIAFLGIMTTYFFSFLNKPVKKRLDFLKLAWVFARYSIGILILLHIVGSEYNIIPSVIIWMAILDYCLGEYRSKRLFQ